MAIEKFTVLLVEDDARDAGILARAFTSLGLPGMMQTVASLDEAIEYLSGRRQYQDRDAYPLPDLMLVNLGLSRKANFKLLRWLRGQPSLRRIPVVVLAAARQPAGFEQAFDLGAASYLVKPIEIEALQSMVQAVVSYWRLDRRSPDRPKK
ncbi:MAG TPA: response regulator [Planctomycetota bacterium]|jgi:CheY-like chemotaxis protein|nr:response regulator [Planctomycetota bacterium]